MSRILAIFAVAATAALSASASPSISGAVYDDPAALAIRADFAPVSGVVLKLYRDGGDGAPTSDDAFVARAATRADGSYSFERLDAGAYWVVADSRRFGRASAWPEQTFGPAGARCAQPDGSERTNWFEGACFGGRGVAGDDPESLATAQHVALVKLGDAVRGVDFAFSFNVVTTTADAGQGSLRQFVTNANAVAGASRMRFVPIERAPERTDPTMGVAQRWWRIALASPLPELRDGDTVIDGTAFNFLSPASVSNALPGRIGESPTLKTGERLVPRLERPDLEIVAAGGDGIVCAARCGVTAIALTGATQAGIVARADARVEHVMIGASPDGSAAAVRGTAGLQIESGTTAASLVLVTSQSRAGVVVAKGARIEAERLDVSRCGDPQTGGGIILLSDGSSIRSSNVSANPGAGIIIGAPDGSAPASANTIDGCTISGNQGGVIIGGGSSRNVIIRNDIMWNGLGGIAIAPFEGAAAKENRFSANRFDENGLRPIVIDFAAADPDTLSAGTGSCAPVATAPNAGVSAPRIVAVRLLRDGDNARVSITGTACPGEIIEVYQSYVTSGLREEKRAEMPRIRGEGTDRETVAAQQRETGLPSIGEFNYVGATNTTADGSFEATFPLPAALPATERRTNEEGVSIWADDVIAGSDAFSRAYSAIAIDAAGNTSEMSVRRKIE